jgi:hypothetical protein
MPSVVSLPGLMDSIGSMTTTTRTRDPMLILRKIQDASTPGAV